MRIQQTLEKYVPLISNMMAPAIIYAWGLLSFLIYENLDNQTIVFFHTSFYVISIICILVLLNFNINRHMFLIISNVLCYIIINCIKSKYGATFSQTLDFRYLAIIFPLNLIIYYIYGSFRFMSPKSLHLTVFLLCECGIIEMLKKHNIDLIVSIQGINIIAVILYFIFFVIFIIKSINANNLYNYTTLYSAIATASSFYYADNTSGFCLFFFISQLIALIDLVFTLTYNHFYDEATGFYSRNSYLIKSKKFPFKYNLGIVSIDNYDKLSKLFGFKKQQILTNLVAETIQALTQEEVVFRYARDQFIVLYINKDNKESFAHLDNVRRVIAGLSFSTSSKQEPIKLTVSCSLAEKRRSDAGALEVLLRADKAMRNTLKFTHNVTSRG